MRTKLYIPDIECDSCIKILSRLFKKEEKIINFTFEKDSTTIEHQETLTAQEIIKQIETKGFRASLEEFERMNFKERWRHIKEKKEEYKLEKKMLKYNIAIFISLFFIEAVFYLLFLKQIPQFLTKYGYWILYTNLSIASLAAAVWHYNSYKTKTTCMVGMMIGMTFGMQTGMMLGFIIGATNGFFIGALLAMIAGTFVGILTGKSCGIMGILEGMMAGLMGGTMGPMISVMMLSDNIRWFTPFYMFINIAILFGLSYMIYEELVEGKRELVKKPLDFTSIMLFCIILALGMILLMTLGPKSILAAL